jgi:hypothetical protein
MKRLAVRFWKACVVLWVLAAGGAGPAQAAAHLLAPDGAWCWFGNPRALFKDGRLYFGYVRYADGRVCLNTYDPASNQSSLLWASDMTQRDDHDNPGLLALSDGRMLAIYAKHGNETRFYYRITATADTATPGNWSPELAYTNTTAGVTYANPYQLSAESGRVYNFFRNLNFNPTFVTSDASGTNWSAPQILIKTGTGGYRPYVQYCSDFERRIDFTYTDGHPDVAAVPTSLYHAYYQDGALWKSDGSLLKYLTNAPLLHDSGERGTVIYPYSAAPSSDPNDHIPYGRAWCWDVLHHTNGKPVAAFSVQVTNVMGANWYDDRLYYYYARWTGSNWQKRFIAHAGRPLYNTQRYYAGGISLDPNNPDVVYLASNAADPFALGDLTHVPLRPDDRYEIFRGETHDGGLTFTWQAVTTNSAVDNLRPYVPRGNAFPYGVIWYAGVYTSYTVWDAAVYGIFATNLTPVTIVPNQAPEVLLRSPAASPLVLTNLANHLELRATAADDGQPGPLRVAWSTVQGPANATFASTTSLLTSVSFPQPGAYVLRLSADDSVKSNRVDQAVLVGGGEAGSADLALWLKLDESWGTTAVDSSGSGNHGVLVGDGVWNPNGGRRGGAMEFNGTNSFLNVPDAPNLDNTAAFTLAYWLRANAYTTGGAGLVSKRNGISDNNAFTTFLQVDRLINVDIDGSNNRFTSVTAIETGRWYHVAITFDGSQPTNQRARLYLNGALDRVAAESSAAVPNYNSSVKIGLTHSNVTTYFKGAMDDIRFYRRALAPEEIVALAAAGSAPSAVAPPGLAATNRVPAWLAGGVAGDASEGPLAVLWSAESGPAPVDFAEPGEAASAVTFNAAGPYVLRLWASNQAAQVFALLPVSVSLNEKVYGDWISLAFPGETNETIVGPYADPDWDGARNLLEFALGLRPGILDAQPHGPTWPGLPVGGLVEVSNAHYLALRVKRPQGLLQVAYAAEISPDLVQWFDAPAPSGPLDNGDGTETIVFQDPVATRDAPSRYMRLRVTLL